MPRCAQVAAARPMTATITKRRVQSTGEADLAVRAQSTLSSERLQHARPLVARVTSLSLPCVSSDLGTGLARVRVRAPRVSMHGCTMGSNVSRRRLCSTSQALQDENLLLLVAAGKLNARVAELDGEAAELAAKIEAMDRVAAYQKAENSQLKVNYAELKASYEVLMANHAQLRVKFAELDGSLKSLLVARMR